MKKPKASSYELWRRRPEAYKGAAIRAAPGLHAAAMDLLRSYTDARKGVLDVAAGTGAFLLRLRDHGYSNISAIELDIDSFAVTDIQPHALDLNDCFAKVFDREFELVTALEIIEHLDNPRHFLREIRQLLCDGGLLLVSTPNIAHWAGRLRFLVQGELRYFRESDYHLQRHITPIPDSQMILMLREIGFRLIDKRCAGSFLGPLKKTVMAPLSLPLQWACGANGGDAVVYLAERAEPDMSSKGASSDYQHKIGR